MARGKAEDVGCSYSLVGLITGTKLLPNNQTFMLE